MLIRPTLIVVFDAVKDSITVVTPVRPEQGVTAAAALARAQERLSAIVDALDRPLDKAASAVDAGPLDVPPQSNTTPAEYRDMVLKAKDYILAGDIFQVVLSQRFEAPFKLLAILALSRAAAREPGAVSVLPRLRRLRGRRLQPGNPGACRAAAR